MRGADLWEEFVQANSYRDQGCRRLLELGIPPGTLYGPRSHIGIARIAPDASGTYQPDPNGLGALIVPVGEPDHPFGWRYIDDLVAFAPDRPGVWWLRCRAVTLLQEINVDFARAKQRGNAGPPLFLAATPLSYLQAGPDGPTACVLDWSRIDPDQAFHGLSITCHDAVRERLLSRQAELTAPRFVTQVVHAQRAA